MRYFLTFILFFLLMSALPLLWNQFSFVEAGFPFWYVQKKTVELPGYMQSAYYYQPLNLLYDLIVTAIFVWLLMYLRGKITLKNT